MRTILRSCILCFNLSLQLKSIGKINAVIVLVLGLVIFSNAAEVASQKFHKSSKSAEVGASKKDVSPVDPRKGYFKRCYRPKGTEITLPGIANAAFTQSYTYHITHIFHCD